MSERRAWAGVALVVMLLAVFGAYYWVHKPLTPAQALALVGSLANVGIAGLLGILGGGLGRSLLARWYVQATLHPGEKVLLDAALGWGLMALGMLGLGLANLFYPALIWTMAFVGLVTLWKPGRAWWTDLAHVVRSWLAGDRIRRLAGAYLWLMLGLGLLRAAAPPLMWDALVYHLTLPKLYAQTHGLRLSLSDFSLFSGMPQLSEMLYTAAMLLRLDIAAGGVAAQTLGWLFGLVLAVGLTGLATTLGLPGALVPALLFSAFSVLLSLAWAYADLLLMVVALAMIVALREWRRQGGVRWLVLAGACAGLALGAKYTGIVVPLGGIAVVLYSLLTCPARSDPADGRTIRRRAKITAGFVLPMGLLAAPWFLKNWLITGSPVYPLVFPAADMDALRQWFYSRPDLAERNPLWAALVYWRGAIAGVQGANNYDATLGPLLLLLPMTLPLVWRQLPDWLRVELKPLALFTGAAYVVWIALTFVSPLALQVRLFYPALPIIAVLGVAAWCSADRLNTSSLRVSHVLGAALVLGFVLSAIEAVSHFAASNPLPYLAGAQSRRDYESGRLGWYPFVFERINALPAGSRVEFLWEARSLACLRPGACVPDVVIDRWWHSRRTLGSAANILDSWRTQHVTHILIYDAGQVFAQGSDDIFLPSDWTELAQLRQRLRLVEKFGDGYSLYAVD